MDRMEFDLVPSPEGKLVYVVKLPPDVCEALERGEVGDGDLTLELSGQGRKCSLEMKGSAFPGAFRSLSASAVAEVYEASRSESTCSKLGGIHGKFTVTSGLEGMANTLKKTYDSEKASKDERKLVVEPMSTSRKGVRTVKRRSDLPSSGQSTLKRSRPPVSSWSGVVPPSVPSSSKLSTGTGSSRLAGSSSTSLFPPRTKAGESRPPKTGSASLGSSPMRGISPTGSDDGARLTPSRGRESPAGRVSPLQTSANDWDRKPLPSYAAPQLISKSRNKITANPRNTAANTNLNNHADNHSNTPHSNNHNHNHNNLNSNNKPQAKRPPRQPDSEGRREKTTNAADLSSIEKDIIHVLAIGALSESALERRIPGALKVVKKVAEADTRTSEYHLRSDLWPNVSIEWDKYTDEERDAVVQNIRRSQILSESELEKLMKKGVPSEPPTSYPSIRNRDEYELYRVKFNRKYRIYNTLGKTISELQRKFEKYGTRWRNASSGSEKEGLEKKLRELYERTEGEDAKRRSYYSVLHVQLRDLKQHIVKWAKEEEEGEGHES